MENQSAPQKTRDEAFVESIIKRCQTDKSVSSRLKKATNPSLEYQSWEVLAAYNIDLENPMQRSRHALISAAIANGKVLKNGANPLGKMLAMAYPDGSSSSAAIAKLRRLLACHDAEEACRVLRPLINLIQSRCSQPFDYARLLTQLRYFDFNSQQTKAQWAQEFYGTVKNPEEESA